MNKHYYTVKLRVDDVSDDGVFEGYASVFNEYIPSYNEMVDKGAYTKTISENGGNVPVLYMHDDGFFSGHPPIGMGLSAAEDLHGLAVKAQLSIDSHEIAKETWGFMKITHKVGRKMGLSVGFAPIQEEQVEGVYHVKEAKLFEYSITPPDWQAGPSAGVTNMRDSYMRESMRYTVQLLTDLGVHIPNASRIDDYLSDNWAGRGITSTDNAHAPEPDNTTQAATNTDESHEVHSLLLELNETFANTVNKLKSK